MLQGTGILAEISKQWKCIEYVFILLIVLVKKFWYSIKSK